MMDWPMHAFTSKALKSNKKDGKSTGFLWTRGGDQFEMEEIFGSLFGFLAVFAFKFCQKQVWHPFRHLQQGAISML